MSFKTPLICDRRVYAFKGTWKSPNNDIGENIYYFIKEQRQLVTSYVNGREELKEQMTITVFGTKPFAKEDIITLQNGTKYRIINIMLTQLEPNILVRDMVKPRYESTELILE